MAAPGVGTLPASAVTAGSATLNGSVSPNALATSWFFQYGTNAAFGSVTPAGQIPAQTALQFNGLNQHGTLTGLSLSNRSFTIEFWARRDGLDRRDYILGQGTNTTRRGLHVGFRENNRFTFAFWSDDLDAPLAASDNAWHHWACTYNLTNNQRIIYRDGVGVATNNASGPYLGDGPVLLARMAHADVYFGGGVDELRVWGDVRTAAQISANRYNLLTGAESGLLGYWRLDDGAGVTAADTSPQNNPFVLAGAPMWTAGIPHATQLAVSAPLAALQGGTTYHFRLVASNSVGTAYGNTLTFTTPVAGLGVTTLPATAIVQNAATLNGAISPNALATRWFFQYGLTTNYSATTPAALIPAQSALQFNGSNSAGAYVNLSNRSFSVEFWARRDSSNRWDVILGQGTGSNRNGLHIGFRTNNRFTFAFWGDDLDAPLAMSDNAWHHWACTYNLTNNQRIIYRDGVGVATNTATGPFLGFGDFNGMIFVGRFDPLGSQGNWYRGALDEIRVWDHVRTPAQISGNRSNLLAANLPGMLAYWRLDEGSGMSSGDTSGQGRDLIFNAQLAWIPGVPHAFDWPVSAALAGLYANTTYHFRLVGSNSAGQAFGLNQSFTTPPVPQIQTVVVPPNPIGGRQAKVWPATVVFGQFYGFDSYNFGIYPHADGFSRLAFPDGGAGYFGFGSTRVVSSGGSGAGFGASVRQADPRTGRGPIGEMVLWSRGSLYTDDTTLVVEPPHKNDFQSALDNTNATTIQLQSGTYFQNAVIGRNLTIRGEGIGRTIVSGGLMGSVFKILPGATVVLEDMTILDGLAPSGGGILNDGNLTVNRCEIRDCRAYQYLGGEGGGIFNRGGARLTVRDSIIRNNIAARDGGGISSSGFNTSRLPSPGGSGFATNLLQATLDDYAAVTPPADLNSTNQLAAVGEQFGSNTVRRLPDFGSPREFFEGLFGDPFENPAGWAALGSPICEIINTVITGNRVGNASAVARVVTPLGDLRLPRAVCFGGGVHNDLGVLTIRDSLITNNAVVSDLGNFGGGISSFLGALKISNSRVSHNTAESTTLLASGGAIHSFACYTRITDSELNHNEVKALFLSSGGALKNTTASYTEITRTRMDHNTSGGGGGIANDYYGILQITDSTILSNRISGIISADGGGLRNEHGGQAVLTRSTISGNFIKGKAKGGGLYNECTQKRIANVPVIIASTLTLRNCTISGNVIDGDGTFGIPFPALGAGIHTSADKYGIANTFLSSCTVAGNRATNGLLRVGGGLYGSSLSSFSTTLSNNIPGAALIQLANCIVAQNEPSDFALNPIGPAIYTSLGYNLDSDATGPLVCLTDGLLTADARFRTASNPLLGPLQNNGGPTPTHALLPGSPAIDRGAPAGFLNEDFSPADDQRGVARSLGGARRDIGAFEATAPLGYGEGYTTFEDLALTNSARAGVLSNDFATALQAVLVSQPTNGAVALAADGSFIYTPATNFNGTDAFTYTVRDASGATSPPVAALIQVRPRLDLLSMSPAPGSVVERYTSITLTFDEPVWAHHVRDHVRITGSQSGPRGFTVAVPFVGSFRDTTHTLNTDGDFALGERVTVRVPGSLSSISNSPLFPEQILAFDIYTNRPPQPPPAQTFSVAEDSVLEFAAPASLLSDAFDPDGLPLSVVTNTTPVFASLGELWMRYPGYPSSAFYYVGTWPNGSWAVRVPVFAQHGALDLRADGTFTYRPNTNYHGADYFDYVVTDGLLESVSTRVNLLVTPVNDPPEPQPDFYGSGPLTIAAAQGVLANDFDVDGDALRAYLATNAAFGTVTLNTNGAFTYAPGGGYPGWDVFHYLCADGSVTSAPVRVKLGNAQPIAVADAYFPTPGSVFTMTNLAQGLLANDTDPDGDVLQSARLETPPAHGEVEIFPDGTFTYTPTNGYTGTDAFTYRANDGLEDSEPGRVKIGNTLPVAAADSGYTVFVGQSLSVPPAQGVLANDTDADGDPLTAQLVAGPAQGTLTLNANGSFTYTPTNASFTGNDSFTYRARDPVTNSATVTVSIVVMDYLRLLSTSPARHSAVLPTNGVIQMVFNSPLDLASVSNRVALHSSFGRRINFTPGVTGGTLTLTPASALRPGETVSVSLSAGLRGTGFFQWPSNHVWQFTARAPRGGAVFTQVTPATNQLGAFSLAAADFNGDGRLDVFILNDDSPPMLSLNLGNRVFTNRVETLGRDWSSVLGGSAVVADFNRDGHPDVATTTGYSIAGSTVVGLNNGAAVFTPVPLSAAPEGVRVLLAGDVDGDGDPDLVMVGASLMFTWINDGTGQFSGGPVAGIFPPAPYNFSRDAALGDLDGDGDLDLYVAGFVADRILLNDGTGRFTAVDRSLDPQYKSGVRLADVDGDGDLDVLLNPWSNLAGRIWLNDGAGNFSRSTWEIPGGNADSMLVGDLDGDGDFDTFHRGTGANIALNDGAGRLIAGPQTLTNAFVPGMVLADFDGDGDLDAYCLRGQRTAPLTSEVWYNQTPPRARDDLYAANGMSPVVVPAATGVLSNDFAGDGGTFIALLATNGTKGTVSLSTNGGFTYTPGGSFTGTDVFTYRAADSGMTSSVARVKIGNSTPVAVADTNYLAVNDAELRVLAPGVLGNDTDAENDPLTALLVVAPTNGAVLLRPDGSFAYNANPGYVGLDHFTYRATDGFATSAVVLARIDVRAPLRLLAMTPAPNTQRGGAAEDLVLRFNRVLKAATVPTNVLVQGGFSGLRTVTRTVTGDTVRVDPAADFLPGELVTLTLRDALEGAGGERLSAPAQFQYRVEAPLGLGQFSDSGQRLGTNWTMSIALGDLDGDGDLDAVIGPNVQFAPGGVIIPGSAAIWVWFNNGSGTFTDSGQRLGDSGNQTVALADLDGDGDLDLVADEFVYWNNGAGVFSAGPSLGAGVDRSLVADFNGDGWADIAAFGSTNVSIWTNNRAGGFGLSAASTANLNFVNLRLTRLAAGDLDGDGSLDLFGTQFFDSDPCRVWLNDGRGVFRESGQVFGGGGQALSLTDMDGDGDLDAVAPRASNFSGPAPLVYFNRGDGTFTPGNAVTGNNSLVGADTADLNGDGFPDLVLLQRNSTNDINTSTILWNDGTGNFTPSGLIIGDSTLNPTNTARGLLINRSLAIGDLNGDGAPDLYIGVDRFGLAWADQVWFNQAALAPLDGGLALTIPDTGTAMPFTNLLVRGPASVTLSVSVDNLAKGTFTPASLAAGGFTGPSGNTYSRAAGTPASAQAALRQLVFAPTPNRVPVGSNEVTAFTVIANSGSVWRTNDLSTVTSLSVNDAPLAANDSGAGFTGSASASFVTASVLANDSDPDPGQPLTIINVNPTGLLGTLTNLGGGTFRYTPPASFLALPAGASATERFTYTLRDPQGATASATVTLTLNGVNDPPVAVADSLRYLKNAGQQFLTATLLANDSDPDTGETLQLVISAVNTNGTVGRVLFDPVAGVSYDPTGRFPNLADGAMVTDTFTYTVRDPGGATATAQVTVRIMGTDDPPVAVPDALTILEKAAPTNLTARLLTNDYDPNPGQTALLAISGINGSNTVGLVTLSNGIVTYDPAGRFNALAVGQSTNDTFRYSIRTPNVATLAHTAVSAAFLIRTNFVDVAIEVTPEGLFSLSYAGQTIYTNLPLPEFGPVTDARFALGARTGGQFQTHEIDDLALALVTADPVAVNYDFATNAPPGATLRGSAVVTNGILRLTPAQNNQTGSFILPDLAPSNTVAGFTATFKVRMANGSAQPADGFSFVWGNDLPATAFGEEGAGYGLVVSFDAYNNLSTGEAPAIDVRWRSRSAEALVTLTLTGQNDTPTPAADYAVLDEGSGPANLTSHLRANDTDPDAGETATLQITGVSGVTTNGTVAFASGNVTYTPYANANLRAGDFAADAFTYTVRDAQNATANALVTVFIVGTNDTFLTSAATRMLPGDSGNPRLQFPATPRQLFTVEATTNFLDWVWHASVVAPSNGLAQFIERDAATLPYRFYRLRDVGALPPGLVNAWRADGDYRDSFGSSHAAPTNGLGFTEGIFGRAFNFTGGGERLVIGGSAIPVPWTAALWVKRQDAAGPSAALLSDDTYALKLEQYQANRRVGVTRYGVNDPAFNYTVPTNTWTHLVFVGTAAGTQLYVNGAYVDSVPLSIPLPRGTVSRPAASDYLRADVDDVLLFDRALTLPEIRTLHALP